jgi:hypothetical protein
MYSIRCKCDYGPIAGISQEPRFIEPVGTERCPRIFGFENEAHEKAADNVGNITERPARMLKDQRPSHVGS